MTNTTTGNPPVETARATKLVAHADDFMRPDGTYDLAARRRYVAGLPAKWDYQLAWATLERLRHLGDATKVSALLGWRDLTAPSRYIAANDNAEPEPDTEVHEELRMEIRPSKAELLFAAGVRKDGPEPEVEYGRGHERHLIRLGELVFNFDPARRRESGLMTEWGSFERGDPPKRIALRPVDRTRAPRGAAPAKRTAEAVAAYLALPAATPGPLAAESYQRPILGERGAGMCDPLPGVEANRAALAEAYANTPALPPVTRCPTGIASGAHWLGGITHAKGTGGAGRTTAGDAGHHDALEELSRTATAQALRLALGDQAKVLDLAITDSTAEQIGIAAGYAPSSAKRYGAKLVDKAIEKFMAIAA